MIKLSKRNAATALLSLCLMVDISIAQAAVDEHAAHHPDAKAATNAAITPAAAPAEAMANMKKMQEQMSAIHATKDPKQRSKLMDEHMQTMHSTMQMMRQDKGCMMDKGGMGGGMMKGGESAGGTSMMQGMMDQMMQHQKAMQGADK